MSLSQADYLDAISIKNPNLPIVLSAATSLFLELAIIRWQSENVPLLAFYKNFSLLACFSGLGIGYALARREAIPLLLTIPLLVCQMLFLIFVRNGFGGWGLAFISRAPFVEQLHMGVNIAASPGHIVLIYFFLALVFLLTMLSFIPVGQLCGRLMAGRESLRAYGLNLLGSILGIGLLTALSFLWTPPVIWFAICFLGLLVFFRFSPNALTIGTLTAFAGVMVLSWPVSSGYELIHSPYQLLERGPGEGGLMSLRAAGHYFQRVHDLSFDNSNRYTDQQLMKVANYYELPYKIYGKLPEKVAIVGSGAGNDVAAALRFGAACVDAVEIDPAILKLGRLYHPEKPYSRPQVNAHVNDARTFLRESDESYDMVVYGLLDSHTLLSQASSVRLDSFVYTVEALKEARRRLKPGGLLSLSFCLLDDRMGRKIYLMMQEAFEGNPPICVLAGYDWSVIFLQTRAGDLSIAPGLLRDAGFENVTEKYARQEIQADVSTDDWPFFYMPKRAFPISYAPFLGLILFLSVIVTYNFHREKPAFGNAVFFFLGAGFMLIETKAITELGLVFGNTWQTIGIVICGILMMAFGANQVVRTCRITSPTIWFLLLVASLLLNLAASGHVSTTGSVSGKLAMVALLACPAFFSGIVFSAILRNTGNISAVMAINLIGAVFGGILEYNSMFFGFSFLHLLVIALYILALTAFYAIPQKGG